MGDMEVHMTYLTRLDYCQYLLSSCLHYTLTHFADHSQQFTHDMINRYLALDRIPPRLVWEHVKPHVVQTEGGYIIFDDTVLDKRYAQHMALVRRQYSGTAKGVINGIGVVTCVYVNPTLDRFWLIDYRIYDPQTDGKTQLDHVTDMLSVWVNQRHLLFSTVLIDSWYATKVVMLHIERLGKHYYCPLKSNRQVDASNAQLLYRRVDRLQWCELELRHGKRIEIRGFPKHHKVKLFRVASTNGRTDYVVTNDLAHNDTAVAQQACNHRSPI